MILPLCLLLLLAAPSLEQNSEDPSPCPNVFMYGPSRAIPGKWYGVINLSTDSTLHSLWLNILLDNEAWVLGNSIGNATTNDNKNFQIENAAMKITPGLAVVVYFYVQYNPMSEVPRLLAIRLNGKEICNFIVKIPPKNVLKPIPPQGNVNENDRITDSVAIIPYPSSKPPSSPNPQGSSQCGKVVSSPITKEQWPWQIALYQTKNVENKYICGGTLVSARHIITAAHCVTGKSSKRVVDRHTLTVYLGKRNLRTSVEGVQISSVKNIIINPDYNATNFSHDVAILELSQPVKYTEWVRPVCLWPKHDTDIKTIVGKEGMLIGWVFKDGSQVLNELNPELTPVVSQETCVQSHSNFFTRFTSEFTYCAGKRNEFSPCPSAGSGMVFKSGPAWYLRGLVSLSVPKQNAFQCDSKHYTIFTDLAKFSPWINNVIF
ncbi:hypothetical protein PYW08_008159 [Mythimna loreyi]|uniref:Uncharacterized protein n=1 Tax=Mythimna loreyi TaxID=667449 RepID=A0ACC2QCI1_9NEOP|nr:hypothetical protein PYW08_008159 [Mythimna loreyi]